MKLLQRIWRVLRRDEDVFFEIGLDQKAGWQSFVVVIVASLLSSLGWILRSNNPFLIEVSLLIAAIIAWLILSGFISFLNMLFTGGMMNRQELLRLTGFAVLPLAFLSIPYVGWLSVVWFWSLLYMGLRSLYSTKPIHTIALIILGSLAAFITWGLTMVLVNELIGILPPA